jgi:lipoprotein-anchoring transpeptidase ErfK/SrfK
MRLLSLPVLTVLVCLCMDAEAAGDRLADVYYVIADQAIIYGQPDYTLPYHILHFRDEVEVLSAYGAWYHIRRKDGVTGYVQATALSNLWIRVLKSRQLLLVYSGLDLVHRYPADMGFNLADNKERRVSINDADSWRTPEGTFFVSNRNPRSQYYKSFVLNYPTPDYAEQGLEKGIITQAEYDAIVEAAKEFRSPPMNTALGGWIVIHGHGTGGETNWTRGCVALRDEHMDEIWDLIPIGTPVIIEP